MNNRMKSFIELVQQDFAQAMELMPYIPGAKEAILKHTYPKANPQHRKFFSDAASDPETDPETLDMLGKRDLPTKIRYAVIANPNTKHETIEKMARQSANDAVRFRAQKFLQTNSNLPKGDIMESKFKLSTKEIKQIIKEELRNVLKEVDVDSCNKHSLGFIDDKGNFIDIDESHDKYLIDKGFASPEDVDPPAPDGWIKITNWQLFTFEGHDLSKITPKQINGLIEMWKSCSKFSEKLKKNALEEPIIFYTKGSKKNKFKSIDDFLDKHGDKEGVQLRDMFNFLINLL